MSSIMSGFEANGIDHSSASSVNLWVSAPDVWVAKYLYAKKFYFSPAARIGTLVESGVVNVIAKGWSVEDSSKDALDQYRKATALEGTTPATEKRVSGIGAMIEKAVDHLKDYGEPDFPVNEHPLDIGNNGQHKVSVLCRGEGWELPLIGYLDLWYPKHGLVVDLKTTMRLPSSMSREHERQCAIYQHAKGKEVSVRFLYVTPSNVAWHSIEDHLPIMSEIKQILVRQEMLLRSFNRDMIRSIIPVNPSSFFWDYDHETRRELYGF